MSLSLFRRKAFVGLDLGHHTLKAAVADRTPGGWRITKAASVPTPIDSLKEGVAIDPEALAEGIKQLLKVGRISATSANISVAGASVVVRTVRLPQMAESTLRKSIKFEAGRYVPSSVEDSFIECEIIGPAGEGQMDVLIVAAPKDIVESRLKACELAGLEVESVDIEPFAAYRSLVEASPYDDTKEQTVALIDVGSSTTHVSVVHHGTFAMTRCIGQGGDTLTEALQKYFKLSREDAEAGKTQLDLRELINQSAPAENPPLRVLQPHVDDLVREMRRSLNYYQSQQTESGKPAQVTHIMVTGGGAKLCGLDDYIAHKLGQSTAAVGVLDHPGVVSATPEDWGHGHDLAVASGLAMRTAKAA